MSDTSPGWHPDPSGKHDHRYWDGAQWTENVANAGVARIDSFEPAAPEAPTVEEPAETFAAEEPAAADEPFDADEEDPVAPEEPLTTDLPYATDEPPAAGLFGSEDTIIDEAPAATSTWPVADAPEDAPAPPPPYVPSDSGDADGGLASKRNLLIGGGVLLVVLLAFLAFSAFGGDDDDSPKAPVGNTDTTEPTEATGTTEPPLPGEYGSDAALDKLYDGCKDGDYAACDQLYAAATSGSEYKTFGDTCGGRNEPSGYCVKLYGDGADDEDAGGSSDGTLPDDFEQTMADSYAETLGLEQDQAECLAGKFREAVEQGTLNEDDAMTGVIQYLADCDIDLSDLSDLGGA
jgi:hypothetical protein